MKITLLCAALFLGLCSSVFSLDAKEILEKVDERQAIGDTFSFKLKIDDYEKGALAQSAFMTGYAKGSGKTMVQYDEPANMRGKRLLMLNDDFSIFVPKTQRPVRLTPSQRLMGQASNGDVMNVRFQTDYTPVLSGEETVTADGIKTECLILDLTASKPSCTYSKIVLWVDKNRFFPVQAECYALSGKKLKTVEYSHIKTFEGKEVISKTVLHDLILIDNYTVIEFMDMKKENIPDNYFIKEFLLRM